MKTHSPIPNDDDTIAGRERAFVAAIAASFPDAAAVDSPAEAINGRLFGIRAAVRGAEARATQAEMLWSRGLAPWGDYERARMELLARDAEHALALAVAQFEFVEDRQPKDAAERSIAAVLSFLLGQHVAEALATFVAASQKDRLGRPKIGSAERRDWVADAHEIADGAPQREGRARRALEHNPDARARAIRIGQHVCAAALLHGQPVPPEVLRAVGFAA